MKTVIAGVELLDLKKGLVESIPRRRMSELGMTSGFAMCLLRGQTRVFFFNSLSFHLSIQSTLMNFLYGFARAT